MSNTTRVIQYGLGPIGCVTARVIGEREILELMGSVDVDRAKVGHDADDEDHKRQTEIEAINEAVVREVTRLGSEAPVNQTPTSLIGIVKANC